MAAVIEQRSRRIVVVFGGEANTGVVSVLDSLVSRSKAHVTGVFIEDHTLFRTAELPFTMEVCRITTVRRPLRTAELERQMRLLAQRAERVLRRVAERAGLPWSFRRHRGRLGTALADVADVDIVVVGAIRQALAPAGELHATARAVRAAEAESRRPVVVLYERSGPGDRAIDAGVELAERTDRSLIVFLPASMVDASPELDQRLQSLRRQGTPTLRVFSVEPSTLLSAVRRASPAVLVAGADEVGVEEDRVGELQRAVGCPLVVVR